MSIVQTATDVRGTALQGAIGDCAGYGSFDRYGSGINQSPQAVQVTTVTVTDQGDDDTVIVTIGGVDVTINTGTGGDAASIGAALAAAINAEPLVRGLMIATFDTVTLTLTGTTPGVTTAVSIASDPDSVLSAVTAVTAADEADPVPTGRAVVRTGYDSGEAELLVALALGSLFTAQVITLTPTFVDATEILVEVFEVRGEERVFIKSATAVSATSVAVTVDNLVAAVNAAMPANSVVATDSTTHMTLTAEVPGTEFDIVASIVTRGASDPTLTVAYATGPSEATSLNRALAGVSQRPLDEEVTTIGGTEPAWPGNAGVRFWTSASIWVESAETPTVGATAYVELAAGADSGKFFAASSATRVALARAAARWERDGNVAADNLAVLRLNVA